MGRRFKLMSVFTPFHPRSRGDPDRRGGEIVARSQAVFLRLVRKQVAAISHKRSQLHSCARLGGGGETSSNSEGFTPVWSPLLVSLQQPFHRWHAAEAKRAGYSILFSANMIRLNGQAAAKTFLCGQRSLNNRDEPRRECLSLRDKSSGDHWICMMFFVCLLLTKQTDLSQVCF